MGKNLWRKGDEVHEYKGQDQAKGADSESKQGASGKTERQSKIAKKELVFGLEKLY